MISSLLLVATLAHASPWCGTPERVRHGALARHAATAPVPLPGGTCIAPQALADSQDIAGTFDQTLETASFLVAWDDDNAVVDADVAQHWADLLETAWTAQIDDLGWLPPSRTDVCAITVLLVDFPDNESGTGGYANADGTGEVPYIVLNTDWAADGDEWMETLTAHEFNHASQFAYDAFWEVDDWWYWEATAEWIPDLVHDDANTYTWSLWTYYDTPHLALSSQESGAAYGHFGFNTYLEEQYGEDTPRAMWEAGAAGDTVGEAVATLGYDFDAVTMDWASHMAATDVVEADVWRGAAETFEVDPYAADVSEYPASGENPSGRRPQERGQNFLRFGGGVGTLVLTFAGDPAAGGEPTRWALGVATVAADGAITHEVVHADDEGAAVATVDGLGTDVSEVFVAVVPLGAIGAQGAAYTWQADLTDGEDELAACGCATGAPSGAWGFALAGLAVLARRRPGRLGGTTPRPGRWPLQPARER